MEYSIQSNKYFIVHKQNYPSAYRRQDHGVMTDGEIASEDFNNEIFLSTSDENDESDFRFSF
jgi:hypothetical protein